MAAYDKTRIALQTKLEGLRQRLGKIQRNLREAPDPDSEEQALGRENDEVLEQLDDSGRAEIAMIEAALARINAGTYGICAQCGNPIAPPRLEALPYTTLCINCAR